MNKIVILFTALLVLAGCQTIKPYQRPLSPVPVSQEAFSAPEDNDSPVSTPEGPPVLYATTRQSEDDNRAPFYGPERDSTIHLGRATIRLTDEQRNWTEVADPTAGKKRGVRGFLYVPGVEETGQLACREALFSHEPCGESDLERYLEDLNEYITATQSGELILFVHGYNTDFVYPIQVVGQFQAYAGDQAAFLAYSWPSLAHIPGYGADLDTIESQVRTFRNFLGFLAENTEARKIHIIAHSAGGRLVMQALNQLNLLHNDLSAAEKRDLYRLGELLIVASDMDREVFGTMLADGVLGMVDNTHVYASRYDAILETSRVYHNQQRMGQYWTPDILTRETADFLKNEPALEFIDVSQVPESKQLGGHFYFLESSWVSADILHSVIFKKRPGDRGLVPHPENPYFWTFPSDYSGASSADEP